MVINQHYGIIKDKSFQADIMYFWSRNADFTDDRNGVAIIITSRYIGMCHTNINHFFSVVAQNFCPLESSFRKKH